MSEFIERESELENEEEYNRLIISGYKIIYDPDCEENYLFDPKHWKLLNNNQGSDYMFDNLYFQSLTMIAKDLAISEGF